MGSYKPPKPKAEDLVLYDLKDFMNAGVVPIDDGGDWLEHWVNYSIVREKLRKATENAEDR